MNALILVDHGSKLDAANRVLDDAAARVTARGGFGLVMAAHMELAGPTVGEAFDACVAAGAEDVTVALVFLGPGMHSTRDIPRMAREAAARHPGVRWRLTEPLGASEGVIEAVLERVREAERR